MPKKYNQGYQSNKRRHNSYNAPKKRVAGGRGLGGGGGASRTARENKINAQSQQHNKKQGRYTRMGRDVQIRDQPFEYCVVIHTETALQCPSQELEEKKKQQQQQQQQATSSNEKNNTTTSEKEEQEPVFDHKQIVSLGICVIHTPSGTICGRLQAYVQPPPNVPPLSDYCCNVLGVKQEDVDDALPLVDVLENAERWIKKIIRGQQEEDAETVYEIKATKSSSKKNSSKKTSGDDDENDDEKKNDDDDDDTSDQDEDEEEVEEEEEEEEEEEGDGASSVHKIMLAADGIPTIASIFQGRQQYMDSLIRPEMNRPQNSSNNNNNKKSFSYLNTLSDSIFSRWIDIRDTFHRYFRVSPRLRLKLNEMLKETGLTFQGRGRNAADMALNAARLMIVCMKKGCVFTFILESRTTHEQDKTRGLHVGAVAVGNDGAVAADAETLGALGEWKKQMTDLTANQRDSKRFKTTSNQIQSLVAGENSNNNNKNNNNNSSLLAVPAPKSRGGKVDYFYGSQNAVVNEVLIRWILFILFAFGSVWNFCKNLA